MLRLILKENVHRECALFEEVRYKQKSIQREGGNGRNCARIQEYLELASSSASQQVEQPSRGCFSFVAYLLLLQWFLSVGDGQNPSNECMNLLFLFSTFLAEPVSRCFAPCILAGRCV